VQALQIASVMLVFQLQGVDRRREAHAGAADDGGEDLRFLLLEMVKTSR
jgi:hypothetical protein